MNPLWWLTLISGILMTTLAFWTAGQFFIEKAYVLLVFAGIWALMQGITTIVRAFQVRALSERAVTVSYDTARRRNEAELARASDGLAARVRIELRVDMAHVRAHGVRGDDQLGRDLVRGQVARQVPDDAQLRIAQLVAQRRHPSALRSGAARPACRGRSRSSSHARSGVAGGSLAARGSARA